MIFLLFLCFASVRAGSMLVTVPGQEPCVLSEEDAALVTQYAKFSPTPLDISLEEVFLLEETVLRLRLPSWYRDECAVPQPGDIPKDVLYDLLEHHLWFVNVDIPGVKPAILSSAQLKKLYGVLQWPVSYNKKFLRTVRVTKVIIDRSQELILKKHNAVEDLTTSEFYTKVFTS